MRRLRPVRGTCGNGGRLDRCSHLWAPAAVPGRRPRPTTATRPTEETRRSTRFALRLTYRWLRAAGRTASVFEIGYGSGALLRRFHDDGAAISGVDPDQLAVDVDPVVAETRTAVELRDRGGSGRSRVARTSSSASTSSSTWRPGRHDAQGGLAAQ